MTGGDFQLSAGVYYFDRVIFTGPHRWGLDSSVSATAPCIVYVGQMLIFADDCLVNMNSPGDPRPPRHLQIYCTGDELSGVAIYVRFSFNVEVSAVIAGQDAALNAGGGASGNHLYGALYTKTAMLSELSFHYDTSLHNQILAGVTEWVLVNED